MEGLGAAASVIALLQITNSVISYCDSFNGRKAKLEDIIGILKGLTSSLEQISLLLQEPGSHDRYPALASLFKADGSIEKCSACVTELKMRLEKVLERKGLSKVKVLLWPAREKEIADELGRIQSHQCNIAFALGVDDLRQGAKLQEDLKQDLESQCKESIYEWLLKIDPSTGIAIDPSVNHSSACHKHISRTCEWFIEGPLFEEWMQKPGSVIWLRGNPGTGKTILCSTAVEAIKEKCLDDEGQILAYFYFDFNEPAKQELSSMLRSLMAQVLDSRKEIPQSVLKVFKKSRNGKHQPTIGGIQEALVDTLRGIEKTVFFVLDALDECSSWIDIEETLFNIFGEISNQDIHLLVTSRNEPDIESALESLNPKVISIDSSRDIETYVRSKVPKLVKTKRFPVYLTEEIEKTLIERADGMFQWVVCQLDALHRCMPTVSVIRSTLANLPKSLDQTYERILLDIDECSREHVLRVLQWLIYSEKPQTLYAITEMLSNTEDDAAHMQEHRIIDPTWVLSVCRSLVTLPNDHEDLYEFDREMTPSFFTDVVPSFVEDEIPFSPSSDMVPSADDSPLFMKQDDTKLPETTLQGENQAVNWKMLSILKLSHYSVQEYLVSDRLRSSPASFFSIQFNAAQYRLANDSLQYLGLLNAVKPFKPSLDTDDLDFGEGTLLSYCIRFWIEHYKRTTISQQRELAELAVRVFYSSSGNPRYFQVLVEWYRERNWWPPLRNQPNIPCLIRIAFYEKLHPLVFELAKCNLTQEDRDEIRQDVNLRKFIGLNMDCHSQRLINRVEAAESESNVLATLLRSPYIRSKPLVRGLPSFKWEIEASRWLMTHHPETAHTLLQIVGDDKSSVFAFEAKEVEFTIPPPVEGLRSIAARIRSTSFPAQAAVAKLGGTMEEFCDDNFFTLDDEL